MNVTLESLTEKHGAEEAAKRMAEIRDLGGYGNVSDEYVGGLDVYSAIDPGNTAIAEKDKDRIAELAGVKRKAVDAHRDKVINGDQIADGPKPPQTR